MLVRGGEVSEGLDFGRVGSHTFGGEDHTIEADLWLPDPALGAVENNSVLASGLHELDQGLVMLIGHPAIGAYIIVDDDDAG